VSGSVGGRRGALIAVAVVVLGVVAAAIVVPRLVAGEDHYDDLVLCTQVGGVDVLSLTVPSSVGLSTGTLEVTLRQGSQEAHFVFEAGGAPGGAADADRVAQGVDYFPAAELYGIRLTPRGEANGRWVADTKATVEVIGRDVDGAVVLRHTEHFAFDTEYQNGRECPSTNLTYGFKLSSADRT
jgi:hypothetical protein